jgi:hypothetical protein
MISPDASLNLNSKEPAVDAVVSPMNEAIVVPYVMELIKDMMIVGVCFETMNPVLETVSVE